MTVKLKHEVYEVTCQCGKAFRVLTEPQDLSASWVVENAAPEMTDVFFTEIECPCCRRRHVFIGKMATIISEGHVISRVLKLRTELTALNGQCKALGIT